jgi:poly-D-alanine transfer protein DltD
MGKKDKIVEFEDTQWLVNQLKDKNANIKFTADPEAGHGIILVGVSGTGIVRLVYAA